MATAVVTGANSGIGWHTAAGLAAQGTIVVLACRDSARMAQAALAIRDLHPHAVLDQVQVDLSNLDSVRTAAATIVARHSQVDLLVANAGIMAVPYCLTVQSCETQFATNHLGHFALTCRLAPALLAAPTARVVTVSSNAHRRASTNVGQWPDPGPLRYRPWRAYANSKLANLLFAVELGRRARRAAAPLAAVACHPGWARTGLPYVGPRAAGKRWQVPLLRSAAWMLAQPAAAGAQAVLLAATDDVACGAYVGPTGWSQTRGAVGLVSPSPAAADPVLARRLWDLSVGLTGVDVLAE